MTISKASKELIINTLKSTIRNKFAKYKPETNYMPFHTRLLGKDRLALYSFIHSLNTNFGTTIFEPVAVNLASSKFRVASNQIKAGDLISEQALYEIQKIMDNLTAANVRPDKKSEIEILKKVCKTGKMRKIKPTKVDVFLEDKNGEVYLFDIKTVKPNKGSFKEFKRTLLEWAAVKLAQNPSVKINTLIAIPYNPYHPKEYSRWTMAGMLDLNLELKVAEDFWDFLGGKGAYSDLLKCFEVVGLEMRDEIDSFFANFLKK